MTIETQADIPASKKQEVFRTAQCRACDSPKLQTFLNLGHTPAPNRFLSASELDRGEMSYPLTVALCGDCGLMQLEHVVDPRILFENYVYTPAASQTMVNHFDRLASISVSTAAANPKDLVVVPGSNDGTQLKPYLPLGLRVLGVDPAANLAAVANENGLPTLNKPFTLEVAREIRAEHGPAKIINATNVVAHIHDLHDFFDGVKHLLGDDGMFISEFPYSADLLDKVEFDTIYHEHLSYFASRPYQRLLQRHGLSLVDIERLTIHGGSLRVFASKSSNQSAGRVRELLDYEQARNLGNIEPYQQFKRKVHRIRLNLFNLLSSFVDRGDSVVGYGASAKGNILTNFCQLGPEIVQFIVDSTPYKQGKFTPGMHIPVAPESKLLETQPNYAVLFAWNFEEEIIKKQQEYIRRGGNFVVPIPNPAVIRPVLIAA